jgi:hypothetical protein
MPFMFNVLFASGRVMEFGTIDIAGLIIQILTHDEEHRASLI